MTCSMMGSHDIVSALKKHLGVPVGEVDPKNEFSLVHVQCLGSCDTAPVVQVNEVYCENMNPDKACDLVTRLRKGDQLKHEASS